MGHSVWRGPFYFLCLVIAMETFIFVLEIIGTLAFSVSGAMTAIKKKMDIFGVIILGLITAVGGGVIRDLVLGITPPNTFNNPVYALCSAATSIIVFLPNVRRHFVHHPKLYDKLMFLMDTAGLAIFTVVGVQIATQRNVDCNLFLLVFVGVITGVGGGVMRDVLAQNMPYIFVKHIYACASIAGALTSAILWLFVPAEAAMTVGAAVVVLIRVLSAHFRWSLPHPVDVEDK